MNFKNVLMVEGIYDYHCFEMFKTFLGITDLHVFPGTNADSLRYLISLMIAAQIDYRVLWDNDPEGRSCLQKAKRIYGENEAKRFRLLPLNGAEKERRLEDLFLPEDIEIIKINLDIESTTFEKLMVALFYAKDRDRIIDLLATETKKRFEQILDDTVPQYDEEPVR